MNTRTVRTNSGIREMTAIKDYNTLPKEIKKNKYRQLKTKVKKIISEQGEKTDNYSLNQSVINK